MIRFLQIFHAFYIGSWVVTHRAWTIVPHESPSPFTSSLLYCFSTAVPVRCTRLSYPTAIPIFFCPPYPSACFFLHYPWLFPFSSFPTWSIKAANTWHACGTMPAQSNPHGNSMRRRKCARCVALVGPSRWGQWWASLGLSRLDSLALVWQVRHCSYSKTAMLSTLLLQSSRSCCMTRNMRTITRPQLSLRSCRLESKTHSKWEWREVHIHRDNERVHKMLTWKTLKGKNHGSPQTPNYHYVKEYNRGHRGNDLVLTHFAEWRLQQRITLYISLSLYTVTTIQQ